MQSSDFYLNLPDLEQAIHRHPVIVAPDTQLVDVISLMGLSCTSQYTIGSDNLRDTSGVRLNIAAPAVGMEEQIDMPSGTLRDRHYAVVMEASRVLGIFAERDIVQLLASGNRLQSQVKIAELIKPPISTLSLSDAVNIFTPVLFFRQSQIYYLPILDERKQLLGIVTPTSILQALKTTNLFKLGTVGEVMNTQLICADRTASVEKIAQLMTEYRVSCVVITKEVRNEANNAVSGSLSSIPVGVVTERQIIQAWCVGMDLAQTPAASVMRRLGHELNPENSLLYAYQQMQIDRMEMLLVRERQSESSAVQLGIITEMELLSSLEPVQIYKRLKRTQQSVSKLQAEKAELLRLRNAELEKEVERRTAQLQEVLATVERQAKQATLLNQIVHAMRGTLALDEIIQIAANQLHSALNVSRCLIFRPDADRELGIRYVSEATSEGNSLIGIHCGFYRRYDKELAQGESLVFARIDRGEPPEILEAVKTCNIRALMIVPLIYQQSYLGGISLNECKGEREWTEEEVAFVKAIADHCAIAIHQAELYEQLQTQLQERQKAEAALQESNELFRQLGENLHQGFFVRDPRQNKLLYGSPALDKIWGGCIDVYNNPTQFLDAVHPEDRDRVIAAVESQISGQPYDQEYRIIRPDGQTRWVLTRAFPLKNEGGEIYRVTGIVEDITDRKLSEVALREQQQFLRTVIDTNPNLIFVIDRDGRYVLVNQACADTWGMTVEQMVGKKIREFNNNPADVERLRHDDMEVMTTLNTKFIAEESVTICTGELRWFQTVKTPLLSEDGKAYKLLCVATDITARKLAEAEVQRSQQMLQMVMDNIPQFIFWKDSNSVYLGCNYNFARAAGFDNPQQIVGKTDYDLPWREEESDWYRECDRRVMESNTSEYDIIETQLQADGKLCWVDTNKVPLLDANGNVIGILGTYEDITERKQAEEALRENQVIFAAIFNNSYQFTYLLKLDGILLQANQTALDFVGLQATEVIGRPFSETKWWTISKATQKKLRRAIRTAAKGHFLRYELEMLGTGEQVITTDFSLKPIFNEKGEAIQLIAEARDISARKRAQAELQKLNEELETKVQERTQELLWSLQQVTVEISERQQAEAQLQQSQAHLQAILDNSPAVIYAHDYRDRYLLVNHQFENLFNLKKEEIAGQSIYDYWPCEIADAFAVSNRQVIEEGKAVKVEEVVPHEDGLHTYITVKFPLKDRNGVIYAICGISMDITERKRTEEALKDSEEKFQKLAANVPGMLYQYILRTDGSQALLYASPRCREIWELEPEEMQADFQKSFEMIHPDDVQSLYHSTVISAESLQPWQWEGRIITPSGHLKWIEGISSPEKQTNGDIIWDGLFIDISDRKLAEEALRESESRLALALEAAQMGTWDWDMKAERVVWSERTEFIFDLAPGSFPGTAEAFFSCIHPEDRPALEQAIQLAIEERTSYSIETRIIWPDGTVRWLACIGNIICESNGEPDRMTGVMMDITERKLAEEALQESEWRLRMALNAAQMGTWDWDIETNNILWSEQTEVIFGFVPASFTGTYETYIDRVHPDDRHYLKATITDTLKEKIPYSIEHRVIWPDGSIRWVATKGDIICDRTGQPIAMSGVVMDITDRKQAEAALRDSEFKLRTIVENSTDAIFIKDKNGHYIFINRSGAKYLNCSIEAILGKRNEDFLTAESERQIREFDGIVMSSNMAWTCEEIFETNESKRIFLSTKCPYLSAEGELLGIVGICRDITESKQVEEKMRRHLAAVEAAGDGIGIVNAAGEYIYINQSHAKIFGYESAEELIGKTWQELYYEDECKRIQGDIIPIVIQQGKWQGEATARRSDGTTFAQELSLTLVADGGLICVCHDITERKQTEEKLRLTDRALVASSNGIIISDTKQPDNPVIYTNPAFEEMTGYSAAEVIGRNCRFLQGSDTNQPGLEKLRAAIREKTTCKVVLRNYRKDGSLFWNELNVSPIYDSNGILTHYIGIQNDITERKLAEEELQTSTSRLSALIENLQMGILVKDEFNQVVTINQAFCDIFNIPIVPAALIGADFSTFYEDFQQVFADPEKFIQQHLQILNSRQIVTNEEVTMVNSHIFERDYVPIFVRGKYSGHLWMYRDITERKQAENHIRASLKEKEVLLKEIHHRVKNNLQVISSLLKLQSAYIKDEQALTLFTESYNRIRSMALIHEKLYQSEGLSRINASEYINEMVRNLVNSYKVYASSVQLGIETEEMEIDIDTAIPCGLIINELVTNALKYAFNDREIGKLCVNFYRLDRDSLRLEVSDNGVGLPPDFDIEEIDSLGLQLVYNLTEQLDGEIAIDSSRGTAFQITFRKQIREEK
ncbi:PAS domain S-box protein [Aerosakkonema sp. BLCC-F183]|uniref:PAS domain S-box protein n=1 Tax=Aerosakkonema sp. BLCC-F183 TaxID=3342834 RepID=UPI0035B928F7